MGLFYQLLISYLKYKGYCWVLGVIPVLASVTFDSLKSIGQKLKSVQRVFCVADLFSKMTTIIDVDNSLSAPNLNLKSAAL